jgi:hypothetical protein
VTVSPAATQFVHAGATIAFDVTAWTTAPLPTFDVYATAVGPTSVTASLDRMRMNNGDHARLTITVPASAPFDSYAIVYVSTAASANEYDAQPVVVYVQ